jgi:hypothetical protein
MLADYQTLVTELVRDDAARVGPAERDRAIDAAVKRYSKDRPVVKVQDVAATGSNVLPLPAAWEADFSEERLIEHPIGNVPPTLLDREGYGLYQSPTAIVFQLLSAVTVGASMRVTFTIKHALSASVDTIPLQDREPAACWAAALLCDQLAAFYSGGTDSTIQADSAPGQSKAQEYAARARALRKRYTDELGIVDQRGEPAGTTVALERQPEFNIPKVVRWPGLMH